MKDTFGRKLYSLSEFYRIIYLTFFSIPGFIQVKKSSLLSDPFIERIMLAVTEVNGCEICSFAHTKMALETGMTNEEIQNMLEGVLEDVSKEEMSGVMFAQHYADSRGHPSKESWNRLVEIYGPEKAEGILSAIRMIMLGNAAGIPWSSFFGRFKGKADPRSSLGYEISIILATIVFMPIGIVHGFLARLSKTPIISFKSTKEKS